MSDVNEHLRKLPKVDEVLKYFDTGYNRAVLKYLLNNILTNLREKIINGDKLNPSIDMIIERLKVSYKDFITGSLKRVINATGVVVHTNLGRSPISDDLYLAAKDIVCRYSNLEFDLHTGERGDRYFHSVEYLKFLTGAEDAVVVNNNAAAVFIVMNTFAKEREVLVSRGELIEIGGSFRLPEVIKGSGAILKEVGTTNRTKSKDYEINISENSSMILKSHTSNYKIIGFAESVSLKEISAIAKKYSLISYYDAGSGIIVNDMNVCAEETVKDAIKDGIDIVSISGDKLLGGPQCGIILGKKKLINKIKKNQLLRMLRVDKLTLSILQKTLLGYILNIENIKLYKILKTDLDKLKRKGRKLYNLLLKFGIDKNILSVITSTAYIGGGACPEESIESMAVALNLGDLCDKVVKSLRDLTVPVICRSEKGMLIFDMMTVFDDELEMISNSVAFVLKEVGIIN